MKVLVASTVVPFVRGGAVVIVDSLERALRERGHEVDVLRLPFHSEPDAMLPQMLAMRLHHVEAHADRLICIRTPSYLLQHPAKNVWFIHHHRGAYDLWGTEFGDMPDTPRGRALRDAFRAADTEALSGARNLFTNSQVMSDRLTRFNGLASEVVYPPLDRPEEYRCDRYGDDLVYVSRIASSKRQELAVRAMAYTKTPVRLTIAGAADSPSQLEALRNAIRAHDSDGRVTLIGDWIDERAKTDLIAGALAVVYCPIDEDSYGYASLEAHQASKAVVSTIDAGGVGELVIDGVTGFLAEPTPQALAARFDQLWEDRALAQRMGEAGRQRLVDLGITWDHAVERLLA